MIREDVTHIRDRAHGLLSTLKVQIRYNIESKQVGGHMLEEQIQRTEQPTAAFVLSLLAGVWMMAARGMMGGWHGMGGWMSGRGIRTFGVWWPWFGIFAGIVVLVGAVMLYVRPEQRRSWGVVILVASVLNIFFGMMGLLAGTMGVIGGVLALGTKD
jgi:hypothetical protein